MPVTLERIPHDKQVAVATFLDMGYSYNKIAKSLYIGKHTISRIAQSMPANSAEVEQCKKLMMQKSYAVSNRAINRITDEKLDACSAPQLAMVSGIFIDKARDIEGLNRPQFNIVNVVNDCEQTRAKLDAQMNTVNAEIERRSVTVNTVQ
jgi:hypothetical protein